MKKLLISLLLALSLGLAPGAQADTLTVYPDPSSGSTTVDGLVRMGPIAGFGAGITWSAIRGGAGDGASTSDTLMNLQIFGGDTSNRWYKLARMIMTFDTSPLGSEATINSATLSTFIVDAQESLSADTYEIAGATPASDDDLVSGDFAQTGTTSFASLAISSVTDGAYNDMTLNASGVSNISLTGISKFSGKLGSDLTNTEPTWASRTKNEIRPRLADQTGTSEDPKLVIDYSLPSSFTSKIIISD